MRRLSGGSTPSASAGSPLVTRLIHRIMSGVSGGQFAENDTVNTATTRPMFADSKKKMNFWMLR